MGDQRSERRAPVRPGGRSSRARSAVLSAVERLVSAEGLDGLSIDAVAESSGVHRTTIYRRWGSVAMLLTDLLALGLEPEWSPPDTGTLAGDLMSINREIQKALGDDKSVVIAVITASFRSPDAAAGLRRFWTERFRRAGEVVERAISRGEIPETTDAHRLLTAATAPIYHQRILLGRAVSPADADAYARMAAAAVDASSGPLAALRASVLNPLQE